MSATGPSAGLDPALAFRTAVAPEAAATGREPVLGGALRQQAVWVDEAVCIGCRYCAHVAGNTFVVEPDWGRSRALRQDGDSTERIQEAIDTCPVDCIHWVPYEQLPALRAQLDEQEIQPLGLPSHGRRRRTLPRAVPPSP
ncbi:ferredoxin [Cyanobium gracile UHCC 0139]|uniref:Ferredoxin n=1 Tax=Cyanobium gracile UHCC 0139 TaxID=3110308 RepID=A0ABU5RT14_9CYAN|nr:ferredoxin [Cyanobium gracile]MEA5390889.1 ferredoxin [Cyanobium gracile UHCC 0139]